MIKDLETLEKLKVLLYGETKDEFGRTNFPQRLEIAKELEKELKEYEQYKAIEQELGIDLVTLFEALRKGVFYKDYKEPIRHTNNLRLSCLTHDKHWCLDNKWHWFPLKEYDKTWALTEEELL